jgi:maleate isomerase
LVYLVAWKEVTKKMEATRTLKRIGLIVPSSNVTVETEMPSLLARHTSARFTFHSSRMRMHKVSAEELRAMNSQRERCVAELSDTGCDALLYGCLVAIMAQGLGEHRQVAGAIEAQLADQGSYRPVVVSSAEALIETFKLSGIRRVGLVMPYLKPLARLVVEYIEAEGIQVVDWIALEVPDNAEVGCIPGERILAASRSLNLRDAQALVISACVQMPSLSLIEIAEAELGLAVISAATAAAYLLLQRLGLPTVLPGAGKLLRGELPYQAHPSKNCL